MKVIIYARESDDDTTKAPPIEEQIKRGKAWIAEHKHEFIRAYADDGYSGGDWNRPDYNKMLNDARNNNRDFGYIWTWSQDRLARDTEQFLFFARNIKGKVGLFCACEGGEVDMETLGGRMKHTSLAMAAEAFRLITSEKVKRVYASKVREAEKNNERVKWGRKPRSLDMERVKELRNAGLGWRRIAREIGGFTHQAVKNRWNALNCKEIPPQTEPSKTEATIAV